MLLHISQFTLREAVRSPLYLLSATPIEETNVILPRLTVLHHLDIFNNNHFPSLDSYYFKDVPSNKKIPVYNVIDLVQKTDVSTQLNKYPQKEVKDWIRQHIKKVKAVDLLENPNKDINVVAVYNYNILKDLYKYKTSLLSNLNKYRDLYTTYFHYVKQAITKNNEDYHFVRIDIPHMLPSYNIINIMLKFNDTKYARVITDTKLLMVIDLYKWLVDATRPNSTLKDITDEDSKQIVIEFKYKGYSMFVPLHVLRSMSEESSLESKIKVKAAKLQRIFILALLKFQEKVNAILEEKEKQESDSSLNNEDSVDEKAEELKDASSFEVELDEPDLTDDTNPMDSFPTQSGFTKTKKPSKSSNTLIQNVNQKEKEVENALISKFNENNIEKYFDTELSDIDTSDTDRVYEESILKLEQEPEKESNDTSPLKVNTSPEHLEKVVKDETLDDKFNRYLKEVTEFKLLSPQEIRTLKRTYEARKSLKSPYSPDKSIDEYKTLTKEDTKFAKEDKKLDIDNAIVVDNLKEDSIKPFDTDYIQKVMKKDIVACVTNLEKSGVIVKEYEIEEDNSALGQYEIHRLTLKPLEGKESTIYMRLPKINSEGEYLASGVKVRMRKQRTDLPIRKISPIKVALTSNYGKIFVQRTERKAFDEYSYIIEHIKESYLNEDGVVIDVKPGNHYSNKEKLPNLYSNLSTNFTSIELSNYTFIFNHNAASDYVDDKVLEDIKRKNLVFIGYNKKKEIIVIDFNDKLYNYSKNLEPVEDIYTLLNIDRTKVPKSFSTINVLGDAIPLGVALAYYMGLSNLIAITNTKHEIIEANKQFKPNENQIVLKFNDYKLILEPSKKEHHLLFNGFFFFKDSIKDYLLSSFDLPEVYLSILEQRNFSLLHIKELGLLKDLFLDPITVDVLVSINEPTDFIKLLLRANELLSDFSYPDINDPNYSRIRGYDRVPGLMYRALAEAVREQRFKGRSNTKIELDPYKVWNYITRDNTNKICEDNNPITDLKEMEIVTLTGQDGLSKDATPPLLRRFHPNDSGLISEATVDSGDVGLNFYMTPYAKLENLRGLVSKEDKSYKENPVKLFSTSVALVPFIEHDDPKRINFVSIQNGHTIATTGYRQPSLRTGYEYLIPYKTGKLYSAIAKDDGVVIDKTDKLLTVKYKDGTIEAIQIGSKYGNMEGSIYPHVIVSDLEKNDKFKKNDYLAYNTNFFEKDWLDKNKLVLKFNREVTVALSMTNEVFEDSSAISSTFSEKMASYLIKERKFIIEFDKHIVNLLPVGTEVEPNDVLFTLLDKETDYGNLSESTIEMLQSLASLSPKAKVRGVIDRYEIKYNGDPQDMSSSLKKLALKLDKDIYEETKGTEHEITSNRVSSEYRSDGKNLNLDTLELKIFIKYRVNQSVGD